VKKWGKENEDRLSKGTSENCGANETLSGERKDLEKLGRESYDKLPLNVSTNQVDIGQKDSVVKSNSDSAATGGSNSSSSSTTLVVTDDEDEDKSESVYERDPTVVVQQLQRWRGKMALWDSKVRRNRYIKWN